MLTNIEHSIKTQESNLTQTDDEFAKLFNNGFFVFQECDDTETKDASVSGQENLNDLHDILEWTKTNNCGPLEIISEYYHLSCPARGSAVRFHPLEHLHPLEYHGPDETVLHLAGSTINLKSCCTGLELAEAHDSLLAEEEATSLCIWAVACICGTLRLENVSSVLANDFVESEFFYQEVVW